MAAINFNTSNQTFRQLLGNGLQFKVPTFQRDYSWSELEWDDLWHDLQNLFSEDADEVHYMGYLVLQTLDNKNFDIIDGQQRITTITILILASLRYLKDLVEKDLDKASNQQRFDSFNQSYIGYVNPVTLVSRPKLELNRHNNKYFKNYMVPLEKLPQRGLNASEHLLRKSYEWFYKKIEHYVGCTGESGVKLASFIDAMVDKLFFTVITVSDELKAFTVFETLNSRGVRLSSTDLLKNYLFSLITKIESHELEITALEDQWESILGRLGSESFSEFLRVFWNSENRLARKSELFKVIRKNISTSEQAIRLSRALDHLAPVYIALRDTNDTLWNSKEKEAIKVFNIAQVKLPYSMLLAAHNKFYNTKRELFTKIIDAVRIITFRYNIICNLQPNEQEMIYNKIAQKISDGTYQNFNAILNNLKEIYPDDSIFKTAFAKKEFKTTATRNKKVLKYIFSTIEKQNFGTDFNIESDTYNIEHILPEHPSTEWNDIPEGKQERLIYRIGNMTLLESNINRDLGQKEYAVKVIKYKESSFGITQYIAQHFDSWSEDRINSRQEHLSKSATSIWALSFD